MKFWLTFLVVAATVSAWAPATAATEKNPDRNSDTNTSKPQKLGDGWGNPLAQYKGHFAGSESDHIGGEYHKRPIHADLDLSSRNPAIVGLDVNNAPVVNIDFVKLSNSEIQIRVSALQGEVKTLAREDTCFADSVHQTLMCFYDDGMNLDVTSDAGDPVISLSLTRFATEEPVKDETPQAFTLKAAITHALQMNFADRIEFEHAVQAKQTARASYLNLLPHLSINSILALLTPTTTSILSVAGDLVPFLLPSRWLQAKMANYQAQAETQALTLMRLDTATLVESLFYSDVHDQAVQTIYKNLLAQAAIVREDVRLGEITGGFSRGSTDNIDSIIITMKEDYALFDQILLEDRAAIAQSLGYFSPEAVSSATLGAEFDNIDQAKAIDPAMVKTAALAASLELKQLDDLMAAAKDNKTQLFFNWLDPVGDQTANLGFNLKANVAVAQSQLRELAIKRQQIQSDLEQKSLDAATEFNQSLTTYGLTKQAVAVNQRRLEQILGFLQLNTNVDLFHLISVIQDVLAAEVSEADAVATYRVSRGRVDRLLLQGYYAHPDKPVPQPSVAVPKK